MIMKKEITNKEFKLAEKKMNGLLALVTKKGRLQ